MAKLVRMTTPTAVRHPESGQFIVPDPNRAYESTDPLVKAYPWLFAADNEVERGTRRPGERRTTRRPKAEPQQEAEPQEPAGPITSSSKE